MCATTIIRSHGCQRKPHGGARRNANSNPNNTKASRSCRRNRSPETNGVDRSTVVNPDSAFLPSKNNLVMGQVKILKRGESLPDLKNNDNKPDPATSSKKLGFRGRRDEDELILCSTGRLGPDPETVQKQIRSSDFYAGSCPVVTSPPPSSLPLPAFFSKEKKKIDDATNGLLRLLRLDLS